MLCCVRVHAVCVHSFKLAVLVLPANGIEMVIKAN